MFYIIGLGLSPRQLTLEALDALKISKEIYIDNYTNKLSSGSQKEIEEIIGKRIILLSRKEIEESQDFIKEGSALLIIGNPLSATTHYTLINDARKKKIETKVIPGISIFSYRGTAGLSEYKFGKTLSIVYPEKNYAPTSFFNILEENLKLNAHTLCLLDIKADKERFMTIEEACQILEKIDTNKILIDKPCIALAGIAGKQEEMIVFTFKDYSKIKLRGSPQTLIICGSLNDFEKEALYETKKR